MKQKGQKAIKTKYNTKTKTVLLKQQLCESLQLISIPGLSKIIGHRLSPKRQIFWLLLTITATFMGIYQIYNPWADYFGLKIVEEIESIATSENIP